MSTCSVVGYGHIATENELRHSDPLHIYGMYFPLDIVQSSRSPEKRIVWHTATRVRDVSLNCMLLVGPYLLRVPTAAIRYKLVMSAKCFAKFWPRKAIARLQVSRNGGEDQLYIRKRLSKQQINGGCKCAKEVRLIFGISEN